MTNDQKRLSRIYIAYRALTNLWFIGAVWLYFYRIFITDQQVGVLDGVAFAIGLVAEVPSGALADRIGRDKMVRIGQLLAASGILIQAIGSSFVPFFVGQAILMIGISFVSGADVALFFDRLGFAKTSTDWRRLVTRGSQAALIATLVATIAGGWLHTIDPRMPWFLTGAAFALSAVLIWRIKDTRPRYARQSICHEVTAYLADIKTGFGQFRLPMLAPYVPLMLAVQGLFYTADYGLLRLVLLDRFGFDPFWGSVAVGVSSLLTVGVLVFMHRNADTLGERKVFLVIGTLAASSLILSLADIGTCGFVVIFMLYVGEHVLHPFMSEVLNHRAPERHRATVLSIASFFKTLPYVALAPIIGYLNTNGDLHYFLIAWALIIALALALYLITRNGDARIALSDTT